MYKYIYIYVYIYIYIFTFNKKLFDLEHPEHAAIGCFFDALRAKLAASDLTLQLKLTRLPLITRFPFFFQTGFIRGYFSHLFSG